MPEPIVDIVDVHPEAKRVMAFQLDRDRHFLHDVEGGHHRIMEVKHLKASVRTTRLDGARDYWTPSEELTVCPRGVDHD